MTDAFKDFLKHLKLNINGQKQNVSKDILSIAYSQQVEGFFVDSFAPTDKALLLRQYSHQIIKNHRIFELIKLLESVGIDAIILKGLSVSHFYPDYKLRRSADTDILIEKSQLDTIASILRQRDYTIYKMRKEDHHMRVFHAQTGMIEFHYRLYDEIFDELWFDNTKVLSEDFIEYTVDGLVFKALGLTDGFIFLFLHFVKHYILETVNLKWILDILFYIKANSDQMDWKRIYSLTDKLGYTTFLNTVLGFGVHYLNFEKIGFSKFEYDNDNVELFISDVEFSSCSENKEKLTGFFHLLNVEANKKQNYKKYITKYNKLDKFHSVFAGREYLQGEYRILTKYPFLLPFVWIYRLFRAVKNLLFRKRKISDFNFAIPEENEQILKRINVMKKLDIL